MRVTVYFYSINISFNVRVRVIVRVIVRVRVAFNPIHTHTNQPKAQL
jgi:hypothetical protein